MKKLILHAGMNKTGSSSIQNVLYKTAGNNFNYLKWKWQNHSDLLMLLFQDKALRANYHIFKTQGWSPEELDREEDAWRSILKKELENNIHELTIFSAEDASQPNLNSESLENFRNFFSHYFDAIEVIAYVRSPMSFASSSFQQRVKSGGISEINVKSLWPNYRRRFQKFDDVFGKENVTLVHFDSADLHEGDVVADFAHRAGIILPTVLPKRANDSLSLEALSLLYFQRKHGSGLKRGFRGATKANNSFIYHLSKIGEQKFRLSHKLLNKMIEKNSDDLNWMECRLDRNLKEEITEIDIGVETEEDLEKIALENFPDLLDSLLYCRKNDLQKHYQKLAKVLDIYSELFYVPK